MGGDYTLGKVVSLESSDEILGAILDRKHFSFLVEVIDRGHLYAAGGFAQSRVLDNLEFLN